MYDRAIIWPTGSFQYKHINGFKKCSNVHAWSSLIIEVQIVQKKLQKDVKKCLVSVAFDLLLFGSKKNFLLRICKNFDRSLGLNKIQCFAMFTREEIKLSNLRQKKIENIAFTWIVFFVKKVHAKIFWYF